MRGLQLLTISCRSQNALTSTGSDGNFRARLDKPIEFALAGPSPEVQGFKKLSSGLYLPDVMASLFQKSYNAELPSRE